MNPAAKHIQAVFYRSASGAEPVRQWLKTALDAPDRKVVGADIATVEYGWPIGMPVCRPLGNGLREIRSTLSGGRLARIIFCIAGNQMILLHGFIKKSRKTPRTDLETATSRKKELET